MPNWCNNRLVIGGSKEYLDTLEKAANEGNLFETIKPIGDWQYESALNAWGTKWDIAEANVDRADDEYLEMFFDTAWGPAIGVYEHLLEMDEIESVEGTYFEPGMGFVGRWDNGNDIFYDDISQLIKSGALNTDTELAELNEEYDFASWYEDEPDELLEWIEDGAKARQENAHE